MANCLKKLLDHIRNSPTVYRISVCTVQISPSLLERIDKLEWFYYFATTNRVLYLTIRLALNHPYHRNSKELYTVCF
ncbi:hypothetical protein [Salmonella phage SD-1_S14]|nr:hypothetical protein [Salmonella phage SD-1_S14]